MEQLYLDAKPLWVKRMAYFRGLLSMQNNYGGESHAVKRSILRGPGRPKTVTQSSLG